LRKGGWTLIYGARSADQVDQAMNDMRKASSAMGIKVEDPDWIEIPDSMVSQGRNGEGYVDAIKKDLNPKASMMALIFLDHPGKKKKVKKQLDGMGVPSQFILLSTVQRAKITVYTNLLK
jgi:hypothetical protein